MNDNDSLADGPIESAAQPTEPERTPNRVLVPPAGVHTPGTTLHDQGGIPMVEAPADALADPEGARRAARDAAEGRTVTVSRDVGHQRADGSALTADETRQAEEDERRTREALTGEAPSADSSDSDVASDGTADGVTTPTESADGQPGQQ